MKYFLLMVVLIITLFRTIPVFAQAPTAYWRDCELPRCSCWITTVTKLDTTSKSILQVWEQEVWQKSFILKPLSDSYRLKGSWGWWLASYIETFNLTAPTRWFLQLLAANIPS